jgi:hypothetical protein
MVDLLPTQEMQRWKLDMLRYDFHVIHQPEMMLCECNLLSRYNNYADKLQKNERQEVCLRDELIEGKLEAGMSPNKGAKALAAKDPEARFTGLALWLPETNKTYGVWHTLVMDFAAALPRDDFHPGLSNETVIVRGLAASQSFLAEMCDMDRLMMLITPSGISLLGLSKQELNMREPLVLEGATKSHWIEANNQPGIPKLLLSLHAEDNDKETDWLWVCLDDHCLDREHVKTLISMVRARGARAVILFWVSKANDSSLVSYWVSWCEGREDDWKAKSAIIENAHCGCPIAKSTSLLVIAPEVGPPRGTRSSPNNPALAIVTNNLAPYYYLLLQLPPCHSPLLPPSLPSLLSLTPTEAPWLTIFE